MVRFYILVSFTYAVFTQFESKSSVFTSLIRFEKVYTQLVALRLSKNAREVSRSAFKWTLVMFDCGESMNRAIFKPHGGKPGLDIVPSD